jgi:hypothetical protein
MHDRVLSSVPPYTPFPTSWVSRLGTTFPIRSPDNLFLFSWRPHNITLVDVGLVGIALGVLCSAIPTGYIMLPGSWLAWVVVLFAIHRGASHALLSLVS